MIIINNKNNNDDRPVGRSLDVVDLSQCQTDHPRRPKPAGATRPGWHATWWLVGSKRDEEFHVSFRRLEERILVGGISTSMWSISNLVTDLFAISAAGEMNRRGVKSRDIRRGRRERQKAARSADSSSHIAGIPAPPRQKDRTGLSPCFTKFVLAI
ncbi:hypothetical protein CMUS01_10096 [Colletotrichum musicola]|uniref:Uncharacterized protein n=1 Tax=Colletotrichum musicola TaxID=2175873 RepID=A0A8H6N937_9PEZI|nr:hypothetical protein CMUS01_10096 [Colletotrichum musicola]